MFTSTGGSGCFVPVTDDRVNRSEGAGLAAEGVTVGKVIDVAEEEAAERCCECAPDEDKGVVSVSSAGPCVDSGTGWNSGSETGSSRLISTAWSPDKGTSTGASKSDGGWKLWGPSVSGPESSTGGFSAISAVASVMRFNAGGSGEPDVLFAT